MTGADASATRRGWRTDAPADRSAGRDRPRPAARADAAAGRCSPTCRSPSSPRWTRCSARFRAYLEGIFTDRVFVISFVSNVLIAAAHRLGRRPDRGRLAAVHRRRRGARHPHLHQRRRDPPGAVPCLSRSRAPRRAAADRPEPAGSRRSRRRGSADHGGTPTRRQPADRRRRPTRSAARRWLRPGRGQVIAAVDLVRASVSAASCRSGSNAADDTYTNARREDLIQILDGLGAESRRLESEIAELEQTKTELRVRRRHPAGRPGGGRAAARRAVDPGRHGAGDGTGHPDADLATRTEGRPPSVLLDAVRGDARRRRRGDRVQRRRSGWSPRPGSAPTAPILIVDGSPVARPITIEVIGDPHSLEEAARFRGGLVSEITGPRIGGAGARSSRLDDARGRRPCTARRRISTLGQRLPRPPRGDRRSVDATMSRHSRSASCRTTPKT